MRQPTQIPRVFFDTDVLIAGSASSSGASRVLLKLSELGIIDGVASTQVRAEAERNIGGKLPGALPSFRALAEQCCTWLDDPGKKQMRRFQGQADPKNLPLLVAAIQNECRYLVTFNTRHYHPPGDSISVLMPGELLAALRQALSGLAEPSG